MAADRPHSPSPILRTPATVLPDLPFPDVRDEGLRARLTPGQRALVDGRPVKPYSDHVEHIHWAL